MTATLEIDSTRNNGNTVYERPTTNGVANLHSVVEKLKTVPGTNRSMRAHDVVPDNLQTMTAANVYIRCQLSPRSRELGGVNLCWWKVLVVLIIVLHAETSAQLVKEFTSENGEAARSMEPAAEGAKDSNSSFDVGAILCEKYNEWSKWSLCSRKCEQTRVRRCRVPEECGTSWVKEKRTCVRRKGVCSSLSYKVIGLQKRNRMIEELLYDLLYSAWTAWSPCKRSCRQQRQRKCKYKPVCIHSYIQEERRCRVAGSQCEHRFSLKPLAHGKEAEINSSKDEVVSQNNDKVNNDHGLEEVDYDDLEEGVTSAEKTPDETSTDNSKDRQDTSLGEEVTSAQKNCGIRPKQTSGSYRVVGGQEVQKNSWPWQVAILTKVQEQYCGGTLIAPRWVLTAAHCVRKKGKRRKLIVRIGEHDIDEFDPTQEDIRSEKEFPHPDFDYQTITNDIALIKLRHAPSGFTQPGYACLPSESYSPPTDQLCTIVGWGKLKNTHLYGSNSLQEVQVPVVRHRKCERVFDYVITPQQVCAGYKRGGKDSCAGDSGGPLLCNLEDGGVNRYVIFGVTSYGEGCGRRGKYGIYTKVSSYRAWIYQTISENS